MDSKQKIREEIWTRLEKQKVARFPGARGRIPNFVGAEKCAALLENLPEWKKARVIKSNPDSPQRHIRWQALRSGKIVYMAVPRLADPKPFIELDPKKLGKNLYEASSIKGAFKLGRPVSLSQMKPIDLVVCGSVAVNRDGARIGKGEGYSELEFALLVSAGKLVRAVPMVTSVHPLQIIDQPIQRKRHDFKVDIILCPEEIIRCPKDRSRPKGIYWGDLTEEKRNSIPVLKKLFSDLSALK